MNTLQHSLVSLLKRLQMSGGGTRKLEAMWDFKREIPCILLPDAIRMFTGPRAFSHFEESADGKKIFMLRYPEIIKDISKNTIHETQSSLTTEIKPCCIGEKTHIEIFESTNKYLPLGYFNCIKEHLIQDVNFDEYIRKVIDCSDKYNDRFVYNGKLLNGTEVRKLITDIEMKGFYVLAKLVYERYGVITNQQWFDEVVKTALDKFYPKDMAENTYKYMVIREDINNYVSKHDFSHVGECEDLVKLYDKMVSDIIKGTVRKENNG